jgi:hypothetical protein
MNQNLWGPKYWFTLHTLSYEYPMEPTSNDKIRYYNFISSLQYMLPCSICRVNFKKNLKSSPLEDHLHSRKDLVYWVIDIHNKVNLETGKRLYTHEEVIQIYEKLMNTKIELGESNIQQVSFQLPKTSKIIINILLIVFIILLIIIIYKKRNYFSKKKSLS